MSGHLLGLSLGPVQEFIAAARRTRDLWFGSHVLSEISKAAAKSLHESGATLIFPAPEDSSLLDRDSGLPVANHILAEIPNNPDPAAVAVRARDTARGRWLEFARSAWEVAGEACVRRDIWDEQIEDVLEYHAAWVPLDHEEKPDEKDLQGRRYQATRERLEMILAGRKALRDFRQAVGRAGVAKSSLDGARESVLSNEVSENAALRRRIKVKRNEHLDAVGLVKRCAICRDGDSETEFVSVERVAADPWIRGKLSTTAGRRALDEIDRLCHRDFASKVTAEAYRCGFPRDGTPLYLSRLATLKRDQDPAPHRAALDRIEQIILREWGRNDQPSPYFAILTADGDRIGATLSALRSPQEHRAFSRCLSEFTHEARGIVESHQGCMVYSGGDDVLAFLPVDQCLGAARSLHDEFGSKMIAATRHLGEGHVPTLSVGIAVGHFMKPLEDLLRDAREAGQAAKRVGKEGGADEGRKQDGLELRFVPRSGEDIRLRDTWSNDPDRQLERWIDLLLSDKLPDRAVYDIHDLAVSYAGWGAGFEGGLLERELKRTLGKKRAQGRELEQDLVKSLLDHVKKPADIDRLASQLLLARHMAVSYRQARPDRYGIGGSEREETDQAGGKGGERT